VKRAFVASLVISCALSACGLGSLFRPNVDAGAIDSGFIEPDSGLIRDAGLSPLETCSLLNAARCEAQARCGLIADTADARAQCQRAWEATWCGTMTWPNHVTAGVLKLDGDRVAQCLTQLSEQSCDRWSTLPETCQRFLLPRVPLGQPCYDGYDECLDEGICRGSTCPRTCQPRAGSGDSCSNDRQCRAGLLCRMPLLGTGVGTCLPQSSLNGNCGRDVDCVSGLFCFEQTCTALPQAGTACIANRCLADSFCDAGECTARVSLGRPCDGDECQASLVCNLSQRSCVAEVVALNETCAPPQRCVSGAVCLSLSSTCAVPRAEGEECGSATDCLSHLTCSSLDGGVGVCERRLADGDACASTSDCQVSATCEDGGCVELPLPGEPCGATRQCRWGLCRDTTDGGAVCGPLLSAGATCTSNTDCQSGSCSGDTCLARCVP